MEVLKKHMEGHNIQTALETCVGGIVKVINSLNALLTLSHVSLKYSSWAPSVIFLGFHGNASCLSCDTAHVAT